jgi:hypothetical protein
MIPLASVADVQARLGRTLSPEEVVRAEAVLDDISGLVRDIAGRDFLSEDGTELVGVPHTIRAVVCKAAERAMRNPEGYSGESTGDYSYQRRGVEDGVYLTDAEERKIRQSVGRGGLWTQATTRGEPMLTTGFVEDQFGCELFPLDVYRE